MEPVVALLFLLTILAVIFALVSFVYQRIKAVRAVSLGVCSKEFASFGLRFSAFIIDYGFLILLPINIGEVLISLPAFMSISQEAAAGYHRGSVYNTAGLVFLLFGPVMFLLNTYLLGKKGHSIGKKIFCMKCLDAGDRPVGLPRAFLREFFKIVSAAPLYLGFLWMLFNKNCQTWHDMAADTFVYELKIKQV